MHTHTRSGTRIPCKRSCTRTHACVNAVNVAYGTCAARQAASAGKGQSADLTRPDYHHLRASSLARHLTPSLGESV
eukprot:1907944-Pleurochrysis_carterae.AAC.2